MEINLIKSGWLTLVVAMFLLGAGSMTVPTHAAPTGGGFRIANTSSLTMNSVQPLPTTAAGINLGVYNTRPWLTEKHVFSSTGIPSNGTLVEIQGAVLSNVANGATSLDCNDPSDSPSAPPGTWCDSVADANDGTGTVHLEIDQVYKYLGIAPADWPVDGAAVNIIGYTFMDGESGTSWEIHPVTAWSSSNSSTLTSHFTLLTSSAPLVIHLGKSQTTNVTLTSVNGFSGVVSVVGHGDPGVNVTLDVRNLTLSTDSRRTLDVSIEVLPGATLGPHTAMVEASDGYTVHQAPIAVEAIAPQQPYPPPDKQPLGPAFFWQIFNFWSGTWLMVLGVLTGFISALGISNSRARSRLSRARTKKRYMRNRTGAEWLHNAQHLETN